jgi:hypothetical protein
VVKAPPARRTVLLGLVLLLAAAHAVSAQQVSEEDEYYVIFNEVIQVSPEGQARDISFEDTGFNLIRTNQMVWLAGPNRPGIQAVASRPIRDVAKAGEVMGTRADRFAGEVVALCVTQEDTYLIDSRGMLYVAHKGWVDSLQVASQVVSEVDVAGSSNQLSYVLWGGEVRVYSNPPTPHPLWTIRIEDDVRPVVSIAVGLRGEVLVAGQGRTALAVYDLDADGSWSRVRSALREDLDMGTVQGMCLSPGMMLPEPGREGWVEDRRFLFLSDSELGEIVVLEAKTLEVIGRQSVRKLVPFAAPARLSVSNRGQIAFVDRRNDTAHVLPTSVTLDMVRGVDFRWRLLDRPGKYRVRQPDEPDSDDQSQQGG